jgi:hypothetical protein
MTKPVATQRVRYGMATLPLMSQATRRGITMSKSQAIAADLAALFRARNPLIWIASREEARVERTG